MRINSLEQMGVGWGIEDDYPTAVTDVEGTGCIGRVVDRCRGPQTDTLLSDLGVPLPKS